jgi:CRP/FNR family transcriptional regulator
MARISDILERHPLFAGLPREDLSPVVVECRLRTPQKGDRVFSAGEPADAFYIVAAGRVKLSRATPQGKEHVVEVIRAGESFALMPVLEDGGTFPVDATALGDAALVRIPREAYLRLLQRHPELHSRSSREIAERLRRFTTRLEEVSTRPVQARIALHLLRLAEKDAGGAGKGTVVDLGATREVAAATIGTVREVLIRTLRTMEKAGVVALRARRIEILDPKRLRAMAEG